MSQRRADDVIGRLAGFYLEHGRVRRPHDIEWTVLTRAYRMPLVALALDREGRGVYEIRQRRMDLAGPDPAYATSDQRK
jgi:hypothetical protein